MVARKKSLRKTWLLLLSVVVLCLSVSCDPVLDEGTYDAKVQLATPTATPTFSPGAGTYATAQSVTISTTASGASIRYTTDGSTPSETAGTQYSGPISVAASQTIKAIAYESGWADSEVAAAAYMIGVAAPTFSLAAGTYNVAQTVSISSTASGASIRFTTDGGTPSSTVGTLYAGPISVTTSQTIKAIAYESGWADSAVVAATYTLQAVSPTFNPVAGRYDATQSVTISTTTAGASIQYTTDGRTPSETVGTPYLNPVSVTTSQTLKAIAFKTGWAGSAVAAATYTLQAVSPTFNPGAGTYDTPQSVTISTTTAAASIRYTADGSTPSETVGTPYSGPVNVAVGQTLKAIAYKSDLQGSDVAAAAYGFQVATPTVSPGAGSYIDAQSVTIGTATPEASIRYTTDGTTPSETHGTLYTGPVGVTMNRTIRAIGFRSGWADSAITSAPYFIEWGVVSTFAGTAGSQGSADGTGSAAQFDQPQYITSDGTNLYVTDYANYGTPGIRKIVISTGVVTTILRGGPSFRQAEGITTDGTNLYVADFGNCSIARIVISTGAVSTIAGTAGMSGSADGTGSAARFLNPVGITTDGTNLYVVDSGNYTIRKIVISTGEVSTIAGTAGMGGSADGTGSAARFLMPQGIATDGTNLYVTEYGNKTVRQINISSRAVTTLAGTAGLEGSVDGTGSAARFISPTGISTDGTILYVSDISDCTIRQIVISTGVVTTVAGRAGIRGSVDGTGADAWLAQPHGNVLVGGTTLYVVDYYGGTIRKVE